MRAMYSAHHIFQLPATIESGMRTFLDAKYQLAKLPHRTTPVTTFVHVVTSSVPHRNGLLRRVAHTTTNRNLMIPDYCVLVSEQQANLSCHTNVNHYSVVFERVFSPQIPASMAQ
jgi:hypothetical protein